MVSYYGYDDCIELLNEHARVLITPHGGCRVLLYQRTGGPNAIHLDEPRAERDGLWESGDDAGGEDAAGWTWTEDKASTGDPFGPTGGRFDVGPEFQASGPDMRQGNHRALFFGSWSQTTGSPLRVELTSAVCASTGLQLVRAFELEEAGADLTITQTMRNAGDAASLRVNHWGRTFVPGGGIAFVPLPADNYSRFPNKYVLYDFAPPETILFQPNDPNIAVRAGMVEIAAHDRRAHEKIGFDSDAGWLGYLSKDGQLLVKRFAVHPERPYGEMAGLTCCVFYYRDRLVELEPIGPLENLAPGEEASFVEHWSLLPFPFPQGANEIVDLEAVKSAVDSLAPPRL